MFLENILFVREKLEGVRVFIWMVGRVRLVLICECYFDFFFLFDCCGDFLFVNGVVWDLGWVNIRLSVNDMEM